IWAPHVIWDKEHVKITATEAMEAEGGGKSSRTAGKEAEEFLTSRLAFEPVDATELEEEARANGISRATLFRVKRRLGIKAQKAKGTMKGGWAWALPPKSIKERE